MAVTDLTDSLPYWARQGVGYGGGPGPTGGPGAAPMGAGGSGAWLQYLQQMFGISPAQAAPLMASMQQAPPDDHGDGNNPPVSPVVTPPAPPAPPVASNGPPGQGILPQARGVAVPPGPMASGPAPAGPSILPQARGVAVQPGPMAPSSTTMAAPGPAAAAAPAAPVPGPLATGGATAMGASSNPRFVGLDRPNANPGIGGGMLGGARGGPQGTALNLAGLFGGGGVNPNAPAANAQPVSGRVAGPLAGSSPGMRAVAPSGDDWDIDPTTGEVVPNYGPLDRTTKAPSNYGPLQRGRTFGYKGGIPT